MNDEKRTQYLEQYGIKVIIISNLDVLKNFEGVCMYIDNEVKQSLSQLRRQLPLHKGAFGKLHLNLMCPIKAKMVEIIKLIIK